jgi:hypothetical protein
MGDAHPQRINFKSINQMETIRNIQLTHEEISIILRALGIAEMRFNELRKNYIQNLVNVRGVDNLTQTAKEADIILEKENQFCDLLLSIKNGERDV